MLWLLSFHSPSKVNRNLISKYYFAKSTVVTTDNLSMGKNKTDFKKNFHFYAKFFKKR